MYQISFINQQKLLRVNNGTLADACSTAGLPLNLVCGGKGTCGKCLVSIESHGQRQNVLACQYPVTEDLVVYLNDTHLLNHDSHLANQLATENYV